MNGRNLWKFPLKVSVPAGRTLISVIKMDNIKIILLCSTRFALPALRELAFFNMLAAVAIPRNCDEMIENVDVVLTGTNIPVIELDKETFAERIQEAIEEHGVNLGLVMTFPYKIPSSLYNLPSKGFYNIHPGTLPQYRGPDPVFQQLINKEKKAGITVHKLDEGFDTGPLVMSEMLKIDPLDTYGLLTTKLSYLAARLTGNLMKLISFDLAISSRPQDETKARYFKRQLAADIMINWQTMDADTIIALIKACNPWNKGAVAKINNQVIRILVAEKLSENSFLIKEPGYILSIEKTGITVSTIHNGAIMVHVIYTEEGFLPANHINMLGVTAGNRFGLICQN
jgi:methionyl-tRNA formyltransferase